MRSNALRSTALYCARMCSNALECALLRSNALECALLRSNALYCFAAVISDPDEEQVSPSILKLAMVEQRYLCKSYHNRSGSDRLEEAGKGAAT
jgi:hypothetical protein